MINRPHDKVMKDEHIAAIARLVNNSADFRLFLDFLRREGENLTADLINSNPDTSGTVMEMKGAASAIINLQSRILETPITMAKKR